MVASTIVALSTPAGPGVRAVLRLSGPEAASIARAVTRFPAAAAAPFEARGILHGRFLDGRGEQPVMALWMPGPHSYTREDTVEFHLPGSPPLVEVALARLVEAGAVPAARGEFTRRAFLGGRLDLTRAEGVLLLVAASDEGERRSASALLFGGLAERVEALREHLVGLRVLCEASLDFDETDTGHVDDRELARLGAACRAAVDDALHWEERREPVLGLPRIVLAGAANAGKSLLFNRLVAVGAPGDRAIVSRLAGTTRDSKAGLWRLPGGDCRLVDTAGTLESVPAADADDPDRAAQTFAAAEHRAADLLLWVVDGSRRSGGPLAAELAPSTAGAARLLVWNQVDRAGTPPGPRAEDVGGLPWIALSARTGAGLEDLERAVVRALGRAPNGPGPASEAASEAGGSWGRELSVRHRHALVGCRAELSAALEAHAAGAPLDLIAAGLRAATDALDGILGTTTSEDLLDRIFARFCLGK